MQDNEELNEMMQLYVDHMANPRNYGKMDSYDAIGIGKNPDNGESVVVYFTLDDKGIIDDIAFQVKACSTTVVSGSIFTETVKGVDLEEALVLSNIMLDKLDELPPEDAACSEIVTMAFLAPFSWGPKIAPKNCPPHVQREMDKITAYADRKLWRAWKGAQWGNTGMMMSNWLLANVDTWQRKMQPEVAVVMFGTNDIGRIWPPAYTENMAAALRRMMADGTVPILTSIPPCHRPGHRAYWLAALSIAHGLEVPLIDYYAEVLRRRPDDWDGRLEKFSAYKGYQVPTLISRDGTHPSNPKDFMNDFSEEALNKNGYTLRNYLTLRKYYEVITKVLEAK